MKSEELEIKVENPTTISANYDKRHEFFAIENFFSLTDGKILKK